MNHTHAHLSVDSRRGRVRPNTQCYRFASTWGGLPFDRTYRLLAPIFPGGILVLGFVLGHPDFLMRAEHALGIGNYGVLGLLLIGGYVAGFIAFHVFSVPILLISSALASLLEMGMKEQNPEDPRQNRLQSKRESWCRVAVKLVGAERLPESSPSAQTELTEEQWHQWYNTLIDYLRLDEDEMLPELRTVIAALNAIGWSMVLIRGTSFIFLGWRYLTVAVLAICFAVLFGMAEASSYWVKDRPTYWGFTARLLRELRERDKHGLAGR